MHLTLELMHPNGTLHDQVDISVRGEQERWLKEGNQHILVRVTVTDVLTVITVWPASDQSERIRWICPPWITPERWFSLDERGSSGHRRWNCRVRLSR